ncbi:sensor histidine kinase [Bacteroidetes bacterium endosymbiont of Geopemphigus sp.]|uniref:sensor histidine kinase n=1 Tax=Bacteroidetes bacterium endosymbiont of Geopemphigus sp. TaxID=2047937 RepID=UPI000CD27A4C|nr:HAMP domain-containing sensor histidine kinase [Bacteroidetes bacterium endosymbiont of Geopemphigus sp.]
MEAFSIPKSYNRWAGFFIAFLIVVIIIFTSKHLVEKLRMEEKENVKIYARALELFINSDTDMLPKAHSFVFDIIISNHFIPVVVVDKNKNLMLSRNIPSFKVNRKNLPKTLHRMQSLYKPIAIEGDRYVYYEHSAFLEQLKLYPAILIFILILISIYSYWYLCSLKSSEQNCLWAAMAKETAHQIGTPLTSLIAWIELLKIENTDPLVIQELEKDTERLKQIAERFSKLGSKTEFSLEDIVSITRQNCEYLQGRISKSIQINFQSSSESILLPINKILYSWVIDNLIKNSAFAIEKKWIQLLTSPYGKENISVRIKENKNTVDISITDTGCGIPPWLFKKIFYTGFSTKKRGWGLGLSLAKRIIKKSHKGKIFVMHSERNKGTTIKISLRKNLA